VVTALCAAAGVADVAAEDQRLARILPQQVAQPPADLPGHAGRGRVHGRADQYQSRDQVGTAHREFDGDLAAVGVGEQADGSGAARVQPVGEHPGMVGDAQHAHRLVRQPEPGKVGDGDRPA